MLNQISLIHFKDIESHDDGFAIVRAGEGEIGLTLSLKEDGDIEVFLGLAESEKLLASLQEAVLIAKSGVLVSSKLSSRVNQNEGIVRWKHEEVELDPVEQDKGSKVKYV